MNLINYRESNAIYERISNQYWFGTVVITILDITCNWYYNIVANMAHTELVTIYQAL